MSCPDWTRMLAHRFDLAAPPPVGWERAVRHLERCPACREEALAIDPLLVFRDAAELEPSTGESAALAADVRRAIRVGRFDRSRASAVGRNRLAAAVLVASCLFLLPPTTGRDQQSVFRQRSMAGAATEPMIEGLDRPLARVYEWGADDLSVVMVVDESLDV